VGQTPPVARTDPYAFCRGNYRWQTLNLLVSTLAVVPDPAARLQRQLGHVVRVERQARNLTQQELAFEAELSLTYVGEIERGQRMVSVDTLQRVARAFDLTASELLAKAGI
jgi:ribosome-binding protein aMBF1 (putative translation factor)